VPQRTGRSISGYATERLILESRRQAGQNIRSEKDLQQSPAAGAVWETFVSAQLRHRERRAGRIRSLHFWRDRTREAELG